MAWPVETDSLVEAALKCLTQPDPWLKAQYTREAVKLWKEKRLASHLSSQPVAIPDRPARSDDKVKVVAPGHVTKRGKGGTLASRCAIIHSLCHIESWAVDLAWDAIARFGCDGSVRDCLPLEFFDDFVNVADDECRHFLLLEQRLKDLGSYYGALPVHDGLWESASKSAGSLAARLAVEHCVHEARGLDVIPSTISKFKAAGDKETADLLEGTIYPEEIGHCAAGVRWLTYLHKYACGRAGRTLSTPVSTREQNEASIREQREASSGSAAAEGTCEDSFAGLALQEPVQASDPAGGHVEGASKEAMQASQPANGHVKEASKEAMQASQPAFGHVEKASKGALQASQPANGHVEEASKEAMQASQPANGHIKEASKEPVQVSQPANGHVKEASEKPVLVSQPAIGQVEASIKGGAKDWEADARQFHSVQAWFHSLVRTNFNGALKPPFNTEARTKAGFDPEWYLPLAV
ncbi:hypothetical protein DUNSADRAFT_15528 [Dunaliella salina]|uniref:Uncharacterized protein n=1 Tax=Dunaliella salina TaxID=3046 RepID=A0ABQ7G5E8_DUNSA|nr:hypothetical protein DUNSADRAFT_15528 [Dunaliella salina]|eukprot:KAF5829782.1 hypothetical protein DUNSADRAFT_15528 [Dunaliella salina]